MKCRPILFDNFNYTPYLPRLLIIKNRFPVVVILIGRHRRLHPVMSFASLPFGHTIIVNFRNTSFRIFCFWLELQIFIIFGNIQFPIAFFFFLEILSILFSLLICQFFFSIRGTLDLLIPLILHPVNYIFVCVLYFEVLTILPALPGSFLDIIHFGGVWYPPAFVFDVLIYEIFLSFLFFGNPAIFVPCE